MQRNIFNAIIYATIKSITNRYITYNNFVVLRLQFRKDREDIVK